MSDDGARLRVGTSGYQYDHWRGRFYPAGLPKRDWFGHYARSFDTVEINNTFYRLPSRETFESWREVAPTGFLYAVKFSRYGSHLRKLRDAARSIGRFLDAAEGLGPMLGPVLVQLPPSWHADPGRLAAFLDRAPSRHRWAVEFRDRSWLRDDVLQVLADHDAAMCIHDKIPDHPRERTAGWTYLRFHGRDYAGGYSHQKLSAEARRIRRWLAEDIPVFAYFNNDLGGHAVDDAAHLRRYVRGS
ncbi:MAG: DUF72 domain-containing protein [Acidobacteriota bacterium]|jgi:uncharacterized protein YecE (DUF72 family)